MKTIVAILILMLLPIVTVEEQPPQPPFGRPSITIVDPISPALRAAISEYVDFEPQEEIVVKRISRHKHRKKPKKQNYFVRIEWARRRAETR
ncbi:hypothetical protein LCGC14_1700870 [marine sediment metagenome]|uniref:Uncharacterized protein n=1 Tax=marine sediment metagenome TaxID=412755 RepID=A0A0F9HHQ8_9ZZZZ|nr:hypothetical protein [bacterium]